MRALLLAGVMALGWGTAATATTYTVNRIIGSGSVTGSITTDGTLGTLVRANITAFDLVLVDLFAPVELTQSRPGTRVLVLGTAFSATPDGLFFDFTGDIRQYVAFTDLAGPYYCLATSNCNNLSYAESVSTVRPASQNTFYTGVVQFASATAVPEPASLALLGMGVAGIAVARRRRAG